MESKSFFAVIAAVVLIAVFIAADLAAAQKASSGGKSTNVALIPGTLQGFGSMGPRGMRRFCDPRAVGLAQWRTTALTHILGLDQLQLAALTDLSVASAKALELIAKTCEDSAADKSQLAVIEARLKTMLDVLEAVRPAYDSFYEKLDKTQKMRLDALGPGRRGWRW